MAEQSNAKRLAKNSLYMYIRQGITMLIALYSSRVLLRTLGVEDYGIFNLVGSIISMVAMLKGMFAYTTQRFLNFEMGRDNQDRLQLIYNMSCVINAIIAVLFVIIVEGIGIWFFGTKINIDPERLFAAKIVFHLSVISSAIVIVTTPYDALIIAHEKFNFYALISVVDAVLKLCAILALPLLPGDNLIVYGGLLLCISFFNLTVNNLYCRCRFVECRFRRCWDKVTFRSMLSFSWWQLFGNAAYNITQGGINMVFNVFGGPVVNAARGVAYQVSSVVRQFLNNVVSAIKPYSVKAYSKGDNGKVLDMFYFSTKVLYTISFLITIPIVYMAPFILSLWLGEVPEYTIGFVQITLVWMLINSVHSPIDTVFMATGRIKKYQIAEGIVLSLPLLATYLLLHFGYSYYSAIGSLVVFEVINWFCILILLNKVFPIDLLHYIKTVVFPFLLLLIIGVIGFKLCSESVIWQLVLSVLVDVLAFAFFFSLILSKKERQYVLKLFNKDSLNKQL